MVKDLLRYDTIEVPVFSTRLAKKGLVKVFVCNTAEFIP